MFINRLKIGQQANSFLSIVVLKDCLLKALKQPDLGKSWKTVNPTWVALTKAASEKP